RVLTDRIADVLFTTEKSGMENLLEEGVDPEKIHFVGNIMIDTLVMNLNKAKDLKVYEKFGLEADKYVLSTFHRPSNVDIKDDLEKILRIIEYASRKLPVFIPLHPRTEKDLEEFGLMGELEENENIVLSEALGYIEFLNLMAHSRFILTDSGGIQEEASYLGIPVLTMRSNTERPITIEQGTNTLVGNDFRKAKKHIDKILSGKYKKGGHIEKWDGHTARRILKILHTF
ncbi:MAG: UDP-N-acetyl glucosamine 2-epimerase, partial [Promethearchaeia archaeon]